MIRLGKIAFANCDFPYYALEHNKIEVHGVEIIEAHPVELARKLFNDELDISPISSIMYCSRDDLLILPGLSVTSNDFTKSVLICGKGKMDIHDFEGKTLCIPETTASSAALIKIILWRKGIRAIIRSCRGTDIENMLKFGDAALLIGDSALHAVGRYYIIADMGNEWKNLTGRKMVYALWAVKEKYASGHPEEIRYVMDMLGRSLDYAYKNLGEIAFHIGKNKNIDCNFMRDYLHTLNYEFDNESLESLELYFKFAEECGISKNMKLRFFEMI